MRTHAQSNVWTGKKRPEHSLIMKEKCAWKGKKLTAEQRMTISENMKKWHKENPNFNTVHKKGWKHSADAKQKMSLSRKGKKLWDDGQRQELSDRAKEQHRRGVLGGFNTYSRCKRGWYECNGKRIFMRSGWELKYARILDARIDAGEILKWEYEAETFEFEKIKRGTRSYTPDFKIWLPDGSVVFHEVKGWMDAKSKTRIKRMAKYFPDVTLVIISKVK